MENSLYRDYLSRLDVENRAAAKRAATREACMQRYDLCAALLAEWTQREPESLELKQLMESVQFPSNRFGGGVKASLVEDFARFYGRPGSVGDAAVPLQLAIDLTRGYLSNYQHLEPFDPQLLVDLWERCEAPSGAEARCAAGLDGARRLLGEPGLPPRNQ